MLCTLVSKARKAARTKVLCDPPKLQKTLFVEVQEEFYDFFSKAA